MRFLGYHDAQTSNPVIYSSEALAFFHPGPSPATVRQVHWVHTLAAKLGKQPLVLSLSPHGVVVPVAIDGLHGGNDGGR